MGTKKRNQREPLQAPDLLTDLQKPRQPGESLSDARRRWRRRASVENKFDKFRHRMILAPWWQAAVLTTRRTYPSWSKSRVAKRVAKMFNDADKVLSRKIVRLPIGSKPVTMRVTGMPFSMHVSYKTILRHTYDPGKGASVQESDLFFTN